MGIPSISSTSQSMKILYISSTSQSMKILYMLPAARACLVSDDVMAKHGWIAKFSSFQSLFSLIYVRECAYNNVYISECGYLCMHGCRYTLTGEYFMLCPGPELDVINTVEEFGECKYTSEMSGHITRWQVYILHAVSIIMFLTFSVFPNWISWIIMQDEIARHCMRDSFWCVI